MWIFFWSSARDLNYDTSPSVSVVIPYIFAEAQSPPPTELYSWIKYGSRYDTQGILCNIPIIVIPYSYMSYLRLFENVREMPMSIANCIIRTEDHLFTPNKLDFYDSKREKIIRKYFIFILLWIIVNDGFF